jgi:uncharacterized repeat protein (TIGR03803 family)
MKSIRVRLPILAALAISFIPATHADAQTFTTLANFNNSNGDGPEFAGLVQATNGNYYGTTQYGGKNADSGAVFQITPAGKLNDVYSFCSQANCTDGARPFSTPVIASDGNFYGTTYLGGSSGSGTVYKMTIGGKVTTLYSFCPKQPCADGQFPVGLVEASSGNFYGATYGGTIFEITKAGGFRILYTFCSETNCADGFSPQSGLMQARNSNLYGTTMLGGSKGWGVIYEITPSGSYKVFYNFCSQSSCADGANPVATLIQDASGNLYGTTSTGGTYGYGTVFEITPANQFIVLHSFDNANGGTPAAPLIPANDGNLYGTTIYTTVGGGSIFEITPSGVFTQVYVFCTDPGCGFHSQSGLLQGTNGTLYGATLWGGTFGYGTIFSLGNGLSPSVKTVPVAGKVGKRVIIVGNGLTGSTSVTFNGTAAAFSVVSDTEIIATVPSGATTGVVSVATPSNTLNSNPMFQVLLR